MGLTMLGRHTAEPLVLEPSAFEVGIATEKVKRYKSPSIDQIAGEFIQARSNILRFEMHSIIIYIYNKDRIAKAVEGICYFTCCTCDET
jgi:hypothetical protein